MVLVHTIHEETQDKVKALENVSVIPTAKGLMIYGPAEQIVEKIKAIYDETGAAIALDVFEGGECRHYTFKDTPAELPVSEPAASESITNEETANADADPGEDECEGVSEDGTEGETEETADNEAPAEDNPEAAPAPEAKKSEVHAAPKQEVTFKNHKVRKEPPLLPVPKTSFTAEDAIGKLEVDKHFLTDNASDCLYVLSELTERCRKNNDFCQYVMREGKTFIGSYKYLATLAKEDYVGMIVDGLGGKMVDLSREAAVPYFIEYFMLDDDAIARAKKEEAEKKAAEAKAKAAAKAAKTRKKEEKAKEKEARKADPGLLAGIKIPDVPKVEASTPAPAPAKPAAPAVKEKPATPAEQLDMFAMMGMAV